MESEKSYENIELNDTPISRNADGDPVDYAGRMGRNRCPEWRVMLRHNRDRKTVATEGNPPRPVSGMSGMIAKLKNIVLNDTPISRNAEARECGSEKWKARKARKVVNAGNAERGGRMSGMRVKQNNVVLNHTPISRNADGCPVDYAGRTDRHRCPK